MKKCFLIILIIIIGIPQIFADDIIAEKNSTMISISGYYSSLGGDLYTDAEDNSKTIMEFAPTINHFIMPGIYVGLGLNMMSISQGDLDYSSTSVGINAGYVFKGYTDKLLPYIGVGYRMVSADDVSGNDMFVGAGAIVPAADQVALTLDVGYHFDSMEIDGIDGTFSGNRISAGIGIAGFLKLF